MLNPAVAAESIITWFGNRSLAEVSTDLASLTTDHPILQAARAIADTANSDDEKICKSGLAALFGGLVEPLNDSFTPAGRAVYARVFGHVVWHVIERTPQLMAAVVQAGIISEQHLLDRYHTLRTAPAALPHQAKRIVVLSRVTIGADILLSSVVLQRLNQRYPGAELVLLGDGKLAGLFAGLPHVRVRPISYARRGPLRERLASWLTVRAAVEEEAPDMVVAPDSRLDQLGLLPVINDKPYLLWENTQIEQMPTTSLALLLDQFLATHLSLPSDPVVFPKVAFSATAKAVQIHLRNTFGKRPLAAIKLDHGGNPAKALPRAAEVKILTTLRARGWRILLDRGFGADELANSDALLHDIGWTACDIDDSPKNLGLQIETLQSGQLADQDVIRFHGSISGWAAALACCGHAVSYDSVGHHLAGALSIPVTVAFTGFSDPSFPTAWQPRGQAPIALFQIPTNNKQNPESWEPLLAALPQAPAQ